MKEGVYELGYREAGMKPTGAAENRELFHFSAGPGLVMGQ